MGISFDVVTPFPVIKCERVFVLSSNVKVPASSVGAIGVSFLFDFPPTVM